MVLLFEQRTIIRHQLIYQLDYHLSLVEIIDDNGNILA